MKPKKLLLTLASVAVFAFVCGPGIAADTIKIGYIDPLTGPFGNVGDAGQKHFQYLADIINAKGGVLGGKKFEIVPFDDKISAKEALVQLKNAIDQGIRFVTQGNGSSIAGALIEAVNKHNKRNPDDPVLYFNYAAVTPAFTEEKCSFWHFRFDAHVTIKMDAISEHIKTRPEVKKVYLIHQDYIFGHSCSEVIKAMLKAKRPDIEIVGDTFHPLGKVKDFSPYITKIQASGANVVVTGNWGADMQLLVKAAKEAGLEAEFYTFYGGGLGGPSGIGAAGENRVKQVTEWHNNLWNEQNKPADKDFYVGFQEKYAVGKNERLEFYYGRIRTMMEMLVKAFNKAGKAEPKAVAFALEGMEHETYYGKVVMRADDHQLYQPMFISTMVKAGNDKVPFDVEKTGLGWRTDMRVETETTMRPTVCKMKRPEK
ncbi:MAG: branched-chain amino acid ABC transporter substrate-binding protein [Desulfobacterales bacterium]|jgi:branched-chain amino acid transport system substrate-binding protein